MAATATVPICGSCGKPAPNPVASPTGPWCVACAWAWLRNEYP